MLDDLYITLQRGTYDALDSVHNLPAIIEAPVAQGQPLGDLTISLDGSVLLQEPLRALTDNPSGSFWQRTVDGISLWFE